ncbi:MAG: lysylphosphatidylglycerol synthase transmembrane domain-containing protein [Balneolales bacterium]
MRSTVRNILLSLLVGGFFLWLAIRNVPIDTLLGYLDGISYGWIIPYFIISMTANYLRAERWRLLIYQGKKPSRGTLFAGVMLGYVVNYAVPRLGEITRCVYVAKKEDLSGTNLVGTVILERVIDLLVMLILVSTVAVVIISDVSILTNLFGDETWNYIKSLIQLQTLLIVGGSLIVILGLGYLTVRIIRQSAPNRPWMNNMIKKARHVFHTFVDGLFSIRHLRYWPYFIGLTLLIWLGYVLLAYIPFYVFNLQNEYGLGLIDALVIMSIASIGVALPSPGGIGTYHWFVSQGLLLLYGVPLAVGLAYAFVSHAVMMGITILFTPILLIWNNWLQRKMF